MLPLDGFNGMVPLPLVCTSCGGAMTGGYRPGLVVLSLLVAIAASYTALDVASRVYSSPGLTRRVWWVSGAVMMGIGIWSMHFVGMLAFEMAMPMSYEPLTTAGSMLVAVIASGIALLVASRPRTGRMHLIVGGLIMGLAINSMHYIGMAAMRMQAVIRYDPLLFAASVIIAVIASTAALWWAFQLQQEPGRPMWSWRKLSSAVAMGGGIAGMHYTGMAAARFEPADLPASILEEGIGISELGAVAIGLATLLGLGLTLVGSLVDLERQRSQRAFHLMSAASEALGASLDLDSVLDRFMELMVPSLADCAWVELFEEGGASSRIRAVRYARPEFGEAAGLLRSHERDLGRPGCPLVEGVLSRRRGVLVTDVPAQRNADLAGNPELMRALRATGVTSCLIAPVTLRDRVLGMIVLLTAATQRRFLGSDLAILEELGRRVGNAIENARLFHEAQEAVRVRDEFLSIASHELKTPLTTVQLQLHLLRRASSDGSSIDPKRLDAMGRQTRRLARLVDDLLDVSRIRLGRLELNREEMDLGALVTEIGQRLSAEAANAGCTLQFNVRTATGSWDRSRLEQVITNLLTNAIKYGAGRPIDVEVALVEGDRAACLVVGDRGIGISREDRERIFDRFERAVSSRHFGGLGLGLYISRQIVEAHRGTIRVESAPGEGSRFIVLLPVSEQGEVAGEWSEDAHA